MNRFLLAQFFALSLTAPQIAGATDLPLGQNGIHGPLELAPTSSLAIALNELLPQSPESGGIKKGAFYLSEYELPMAAVVTCTTWIRSNRTPMNSKVFLGCQIAVKPSDQVGAVPFLTFEELLEKASQQSST